jgi:hypothetical protein
MPTSFVKGDFMADVPPGQDGVRVYAFPAEASGKMETGVSIAVRRRWPGIAAWWEAEGGTKRQVGVAPAWREGDELVYALAVERAGARAKLSWLEGAARAMLADAARRGVSRISAARLWGGGRGAVDGARAKRVLAEIAETSPVELVVFEQFVRARPADGAAAAPPNAAEEPAPPAAEKPEPKKKRAAAKKKTTGAKKKTAGAKKKTAGAKKKTAGAKKKTAGAKKKTAGAKKKTAAGG